MKKLIGILILFWNCFIANAQNNLTENKKISKVEQIYLTHKKNYQNNKRNKLSEKNYVDATLKLAHFFLTHKLLPPKIKYPRALKLYREVLFIQPKHQLALESKNMIESIYKSMNRPIPK